MPRVWVVLLMYVVVLFPSEITELKIPTETETIQEAKELHGRELFMRNRDGQIVLFGDDVDHYVFRN